MNSLKTNFVPRGLFDKNVYRNNTDIDNRVQSKEFLGNFTDNFSVLDNSKNDIITSGIFMANYAMAPFPIPYSRQIYKPYDNSKYFELGDSYVPSNGSNLNRPGDNHPIMPFNAIDLMKDDIYDKIKGLKMADTNILNNKK